MTEPVNLPPPSSATEEDVSSTDVLADLPSTTAVSNAATGKETYLSVLSDPINFNVKHPLQSSWTLWYDNPGKKTNPNNWFQSVKRLVDFDTVEDFWGVYNNVAGASELSPGSNYHFFKLGVKPMWEDPQNRLGGKWVVQVNKSKKPEEVNDMWLYTLLACIGEGFEFSEEVCGAVMSVRKSFYRISLWVKYADREDSCEAIGRQFKSILGLSPTIHMEFTPHSDQKAEGASGGGSGGGGGGGRGGRRH